MNIPNRASCHQAMRASRVAACFRSAGVGVGAVLAACAIVKPSAFAAANAAAPAAPNCFRNDRLVLSLQSTVISFSLSHPRRRGLVRVGK
jgi:hypothetical protein